MSCHPGWTSTPGVDAAYGSSQSYLEPLRSLWQGSEGIIWLLVADFSKLESGAFYLDREPQVKHMGGPNEMLIESKMPTGWKTNVLKMCFSNHISKMSTQDAGYLLWIQRTPSASLLSFRC